MEKKTLIQSFHQSHVLAYNKSTGNWIDANTSICRDPDWIISRGLDLDVSFVHK